MKTIKAFNPDPAHVLDIVLGHGDSQIVERFLGEYGAFLTIPEDKTLQTRLLTAAKKEKFSKLYETITKLTDQWHRECQHLLEQKPKKSPTLLAHQPTFFSATPEKDNKESKKKPSETIEAAPHPASIHQPDPRPKLTLFLCDSISHEVNKNPLLREIRCYAINLLLIQYFQAYIISNEERHKGLTVSEAEKIRNGLVHQHNSEKQSTSLLSSGAEEDILSFAKAVIQLEKSGEKGFLSGSKYFHALSTQGNLLAEQKAAGSLEQDFINLNQRITYTIHLNNISHAFEKITPTDELTSHMLDHAKGMLTIYKQLYCLKQFADQQRIADDTFAKHLRHSNFVFTASTDQSSAPAIKAMAFS